MATVQKFLLPQKRPVLAKKITFTDLSPNPQKLLRIMRGNICGKKQDLDRGPPRVCSPFIHSVAAALKHLRFAWDVGPCSPSSASSDTSTPELQGPPSHLASLAITSPQFRPPSFQGKAFLCQALAKHSQTFREKSAYIYLFAKWTLLIDYRSTKCPRPWYHGTNGSVSGCHGHPPLSAKHASKHRHWTLY